MSNSYISFPHASKTRCILFSVPKRLLSKSSIWTSSGDGVLLGKGVVPCTVSCTVPCTVVPSSVSGSTVFSTSISSGDTGVSVEFRGLEEGTEDDAEDDAEEDAEEDADEDADEDDGAVGITVFINSKRQTGQRPSRRNQFIKGGLLNT